MKIMEMYEITQTIRPTTTLLSALILPPIQVLGDVTMLFVVMMQLFLVYVLFIVS